MRGKALYKKSREFISEEVVPLMEEQQDEDKQSEVETKGLELSLFLLVDIADSLNKIAAKIG